jgi:ribosome recycling factor
LQLLHILQMNRLPSIIGRSLRRNFATSAFRAQPILSVAPLQNTILSTNPNAGIGAIRYFKSSSVVCAKKKTSKATASDAADEAALPSVPDMATAMDARLKHLGEEFSKLHGGKNSADMFNHLQISGYGSQMSLGEAGQVSLKGGNRLTINCYDAALVKAVADSIRDCGMSLNPSIEGGAVVVMIPKASAEARADMVKLAGKAAEKVSEHIYAHLCDAICRCIM